MEPFDLQREADAIARRGIKPWDAIREAHRAEQHLKDAKITAARAAVRNQVKVEARLGCLGCPECKSISSSPCNSQFVLTCDPWWGVDGPFIAIRAGEMLLDHLSYATGKVSPCLITFTCEGAACPCCCQEATDDFGEEEAS